MTARGPGAIDISMSVADGDNPGEKAESSAATATGRLVWLDDLRIMAGIGIVTLHAGLAYTGGSWWYVVDAAQAPALHPVFAVLRPLALGLFFLAAGYLVPGALARRGTRGFLKERLLRLGTPLPFGLLLVFPVLMYGYYLNVRGYAPIDFATYLWRIYFGIGGHRPSGWSGPAWPDHQLGHLWFLEALLVYSALYAAWRRFRPLPGEPAARPLPDAFNAIILVMAVGHLDFLVRMQYPIYVWRPVLGVLQVHPADVPREAACFFLGAMAATRGWVAALPSSLGPRALAAGLAAVALFLALEWAGVPVFIAGGKTLHAWLYALGETAVLALLALGLVILLRDHAGAAGAWRRRLAANSYGVYLLHLPIVVALHYALGAAALGATAKWLVTAAMALPLSLLASLALRSLPAVRRVV